MHSHLYVFKMISGKNSKIKHWLLFTWTCSLMDIEIKFCVRHSLQKHTWQQHTSQGCTQCKDSNSNTKSSIYLYSNKKSKFKCTCKERVGDFLRYAHCITDAHQVFKQGISVHHGVQFPVVNAMERRRRANKWRKTEMLCWANLNPKVFRILKKKCNCSLKRGKKRNY